MGILLSIFVLLSAGIWIDGTSAAFLSWTPLLSFQTQEPTHYIRRYNQHVIRSTNFPTANLGATDMAERGLTPNLMGRSFGFSMG